jgi:hypothetical protein
MSSISNERTADSQADVIVLKGFVAHIFCKLLPTPEERQAALKEIVNAILSEFEAGLTDMQRSNSPVRDRELQRLRRRAGDFLAAVERLAPS